MAVVCFDANIIIWGLKESVGADPNQMKQRALTLFSECEIASHTVIIPAIVVGEVLCNVPSGIRARLFQTLNERFRVVPYDNGAALTNARIWSEISESRRRSGIIDLPKQAIKSDTMILSTALANGCETFYTEDQKLISIVEKYMKVKRLSDVPLPPIQGDLFSAPTFADESRTPRIEELSINLEDIPHEIRSQRYL